MTRPLREVITYLVIAYSIAIGLAVAMPHAGVTALLSAFAIFGVAFFARPIGSGNAQFRAPHLVLQDGFEAPTLGIAVIRERRDSIRR